MVKTLEFTLKKMIFEKVKLKMIQATTEYPLVLMFFMSFWVMLTFSFLNYKENRNTILQYHYKS